MKYFFIFSTLFTSYAFANESVCYGTTSNGRLENGIELPSKGNNYEGYSTIGRLAGRTYVHSVVYKIFLNAYASLEKSEPLKVFKYAETGFKQGGRFKPHKTHQNGLSIDFITPVVNKKGQSVHLPTNPFNKFGYNIEFDKSGHYKEYKIDYIALAAHIVALHKESKKLGFELWRVIFDPKLQPELFKTKYGEYLKSHIQFSKKRSWVRHDEHYHVDFLVPCK
ncbi:penicillin-insensitive murein endopeptidase [Aliikangiella sp. IMCC44359]|uniref:penicillin-insensitive murein endopeptidase n=1 Tax=Aliikangiella sp. IMCC44359 TaxID=3459125 RepID=UPI00403ACBD5